MSLLDELKVEFGLGQADLMRVISTAPLRYKSYDIDKRHGGKRTIAQPARDVKLLQQYILREKLSALPVHDAASAYAPGRSIKANADRHKISQYLLKLDFRSFFPSILPTDFARYVRTKNPPNLLYSDITFYNKILFWGAGTRNPRCLSIGAPTSPAISNILLFDLDQSLTDTAQNFGVVYTRYADDITVSGQEAEQILAFENVCRATVSKLKSPTLVFNDDKRGLYNRGQRRMVTGLVVTPVGNVSVGRARKRMISSLLHRSSLDQLGTGKLSELKGLLAFCIAAEPTFVNAMRRKYGDAAVDRVLKFQIPPRKDRT